MGLRWTRAVSVGEAARRLDDERVVVPVERAVEPSVAVCVSVSAAAAGHGQGAGEAFVGAGPVWCGAAVTLYRSAARVDRERAREGASQIEVHAHVPGQRAGRLAFVEQQRARGRYV